MAENDGSFGDLGGSIAGKLVFLSKFYPFWLVEIHLVCSKYYLALWSSPLAIRNYSVPDGKKKKKKLFVKNRNDCVATSIHWQIRVCEENLPKDSGASSYPDLQQIFVPENFFLSEFSSKIFAISVAR